MNSDPTLPALVAIPEEHLGRTDFWSRQRRELRRTKEVLQPQGIAECAEARQGCPDKQQ